MTPNVAVLLIAIAIGALLAAVSYGVYALYRRGEYRRLVARRDMLLAKQSSFIAAGMTIEAKLLDEELEELRRLIRYEVARRVG